MTKDVIVIGAGTSGMMAAISAAENGARTLLIEKNKKVGKKLLLTGGGRCNVTNNRPAEDIIQHIPGNGKFLYSAFSQFDNQHIMAFFEENGVSLKEEDHGRMFPVTDRSKSIVDCLHNKMLELGVEVLTQESVKRLLIEDTRVVGVQLESGQRYVAPCVIVSTGGKTYQHTGSTGDGYRFAKKAGHTVTHLFPTESPLLSNEHFVSKKTLQGLALQDVTLSVLNQKGKAIVSHEMDLLFTHFGISGPAALRCSMFVNQELEKYKDVPVSLDALPHLSHDEILQDMQKRRQEHEQKSVKNALKNLLPERYLDYLLQKAGIDHSLPIKQLEDKDRTIFINLIKDFRFTVNGTWPVEKSFVTGGGISLKEVQPKSLESKLVDGLFFTGEVLDVNGYTGGYNITAAFVTGHVAGKHAAEISSYYNY
ncbi:NAD(P)/FAD-dependent oxidoreductase [Vagococcus intermedius]|uniref:NAD(P)/FAD-dependent oxidoreductase n=1 Tax=Vagococcus intermedius TaxID=2991418 RepID=A0AAF0CU74_9ENTE|nr:NAD(P)/FAD-dependent oxidoreductase [Vagococcus intermedius]WEG72998.1 NAD(P)/FAD-dependent oxidoreductase [Vagococcus intermedius]WEG75084.1 NAD(P)/FAD-dependent oxidoreductase [Vagococcus intermedius]